MTQQEKQNNVMHYSKLFLGYHIQMQRKKNKRKLPKQPVNVSATKTDTSVNLSWQQHRALPTAGLAACLFNLLKKMEEYKMANLKRNMMELIVNPEEVAEGGEPEIKKYWTPAF